MNEKLADEGDHGETGGDGLLVEAGAENQEGVGVGGGDELSLNDEQDDLDEQEQEGGEQDAAQADAFGVKNQVQQVEQSDPDEIVEQDQLDEFVDGSLLDIVLMTLFYNLSMGFAKKAAIPLAPGSIP